MALQLTDEIDRFQLTLVDTYQKIDDIRISGNDIAFKLETYTSETARRTGAETLRTETFRAQMDWLQHLEGDNIIAKLYFFLKKTNGKFNMSVDV